MTGIFEIPIIARGRIIPPGSDAIEFSGRAGARFRAPNPHHHIHDLVLGDVTALLDLQAMPIAEIIDFLAEVGRRLTFSNPYIKEAFDLSLSAGGLTEPVLRSVYEGLPAIFDRTALEDAVERTIGAAYLDGWVQQPGGGRVRAIGTRNLHITAGNVPVVGAVTIIRSALTKSDCLIKLPSNDPLSATAIARTMIDLNADHPLTKHVAVAYWKGGDDAMASQICRTSRIDKITAWGGMSSMKYIQKYLVPGLDLLSMNPKLSISIIGREALESEEAMQEAAYGVAVAAGRLNQSACNNTRVVYVESATDDESLERVIALGEEIYQAFQKLPSTLSTPAPKPDAELEAELRALKLEEEMYWVKGDTVKGGVVVSRFSDRVEFHEKLSNRIVNIVPMPNLRAMLRWCDDTTQAVGIYPDRLNDELRDALGLAGAQWLRPLKIDKSKAQAIETFLSMPQDGFEPLRRMVRWVIDDVSSNTPNTFRDAAE